MDKNAIWKWLILVALTAGSLVVVSPPKQKIRYGLDLKGGTSFEVGIDEEQIRKEIRSRSATLTDEEVEHEVRNILSGAQDRALEVLRNRVDSLGISEPIIFPGKNNRIIIQLPGIDENMRKEAEKSILSVAFLEFRMVHEKNEELVDKLFEKNLAPEGYSIDRVGNEILYKRDMRFSDSAMDSAYREKLGRFNVPDAGYEFMLERVDKGKGVAYRPFFVKRRRELSGEYLKDASVDYRALGQPVVKIQFDSQGARKFANITSDYAPGGAKNPNPNKMCYLAIVLDGTLYSAPYIREAIHGGRAEISGSFSLAEATFLSNILRAGSLPAPVKIVEKRFVAPSLGSDSIRNGVRAAIWGGIGVLAFMQLYYHLSGVIANLALLLNMILLPLGMVATAGFLGIFSKESLGGGPIKLPVLTLPGIAGIALTIGMAVDANILIFERIREESRLGKRLWSAIIAGYERAFLAILDSNLTTILTGIILFIFGSGPIRGFAVTLCAGLIVSMYTAVVVTKLFFGVIVSKTKIQTLKMFQIIKNPNIDFLKRWKTATIISVVVIIVSWVLMIVQGNKDLGRILGVDFTGGLSVTLTFEKKQLVASIRDALASSGIKDAYIQYQEEIEKGGNTFLQIRTGATLIDGKKPADLIKNALKDKFPDAGFTVAQEDEVGPQVGEELKRRAVMSLVIALVGMIIYISWRFELAFAMGAIVALIHDVLVTIGLYSAFGRQHNLTIIAVLLTIIGYSVNDTIVIFDRIRENLRLMRDKSFREICNISVNQTLGRTILTSLTVLISIALFLVFCRGDINDFALAMCIGVVTGTYSTVFIATPVVLLWHRGRKPEFATKRA